MKLKRVFTVLVVVFLFFGVMLIWDHEWPKYAEFFLRCVTPLGTITAVLLALYGDFLRGWFYPVEIKIIVPPDEETNDYLDEIPETHRKVYCHHLRVKNSTPKKPIENCRIWLKTIEIKKEDKWNRIPFTVPRLMEWAPSEYERNKRTFSTDQVFDLGKIYQDNAEFLLTIDRTQEAAKNRLKDMSPAGTTLKCVFFATADNYLKEDPFTFEIDVPTQRPEGTIVKAKVTKVTSA